MLNARKTSKKDYELLACALAQVNYRYARDSLINSCIDVFTETNEEFNPVRFRKAVELIRKAFANKGD